MPELPRLLFVDNNCSQFTCHHSFLLYRLIQIDRRLIILAKQGLLTLLIPQERPLRHIRPFVVAPVIYLDVSDTVRVHAHAVGFIFPSGIRIDISPDAVFFLFRCPGLFYLLRRCGIFVLVFLRILFLVFVSTLFYIFFAIFQYSFG